MSKEDHVISLAVPSSASAVTDGAQTNEKGIRSISLTIVSLILQSSFVPVDTSSIAQEKRFQSLCCAEICVVLCCFEIHCIIETKKIRSLLFCCELLYFSHRKNKQIEIRFFLIVFDIIISIQ